MEIGTKVAYSVQWLKNTGLSHSEFSRYRGEIIEIIPMGKAQLAEIRWSHGETQKVLVENLAVVGPNRKFCQC